MTGRGWTYSLAVSLVLWAVIATTTLLILRELV